jgi:hypothetical protein
MSGAVRRGDAVLVDELGQGLLSASIAFGTKLRYGRDSPYAKWTHIAIVYDALSDDPSEITLVEARARTSVHKAPLSKYADRYGVVHTEVHDRDWREIRLFLDRTLKARERYDYVAYAGLTLYALTGTKLCISSAGTATCSGLVADALTRAGFVWTRPAYAMTPANVAEDLVASHCRITSRVVEPKPRSITSQLSEVVSGMRR